MYVHQSTLHAVKLATTITNKNCKNRAQKIQRRVSNLIDFRHRPKSH